MVTVSASRSHCSDQPGRDCNNSRRAQTEQRLPWLFESIETKPPEERVNFHDVKIQQEQPDHECDHPCRHGDDGRARQDADQRALWRHPATGDNRAEEEDKYAGERHHVRAPGPLNATR